ncbi:hypothetical protein [Actinoallomurus sp. CA-150999]|uniref:hypothetical protein n=1 Tax=Actinoallomurus sp. CA-150999 TaxID=3239887 RepID=UPI003D8E7822
MNATSSVPPSATTSSPTSVHPLAEADLTKLYGGGAEGYIDYPTMAEEAAAR